MILSTATVVYEHATAGGAQPIGLLEALASMGPSYSVHIRYFLFRLINAR